MLLFVKQAEAQLLLCCCCCLELLSLVFNHT